MATAHDAVVSVLVGPSCPTCEADDLQLGGAARRPPRRTLCRDCGTEYRWYDAPSEDAEPPEPTCPGCGVHHVGG